MASSNHRTCSIPGQFYQELEPRGGNLSTILNIISMGKYARHSTFSKHRTRGSPITPNQNPLALKEARNTRSNSVRKIGIENIPSNCPYSVGPESAGCFQHASSKAC